MENFGERRQRRHDFNDLHILSRFWCANAPKTELRCGHRTMVKPGKLIMQVLPPEQVLYSA